MARSLHYARPELRRRTGASTLRDRRRQLNTANVRRRVCDRDRDVPALRRQTHGGCQHREDPVLIGVSQGVADTP